ncbi:helix-turn-helix domain-containing protein [Paenibacillus sp. GCM10012303]|jgi:AraC-like DNA-binding protein|uniref:helix-turn-helix domain-containing protein n=1 Tax=Paenibacillus sp. GCM10012303 TaxID=3317340 RepID=UPI00362295A2
MIRRRKSVFLTLWLSYIAILIIPVSVSFALYTSMEKTMVENASRSNLAMLEQVRQIVDNHLQEIEQIAVQIATHPKLQTLWTIRDSEKYIQYEEAVRALMNIGKGSGFVDSFFIHMRDEDIILTSRVKTDAETYFTKLYPYADKTLEQVRSDLLSGYHFKTYWPVTAMLDGATRRNVIQSAVSLPLGEAENVWGTLIMTIGEEQIYNLLKKIEWVNSGSIYILDDTGQVILSTSGNYEFSERLRQEIAGGSGYQSYSDGGKDSMLSYTTGQSGWKYVSLVPEAVVLQRVNEIEVWAISLLAFVVIAGTVAAYWMAYRSYSPIRDMVFALMNGNPADKAPVLGNEYEFIKTSIAETMAEGKELKDKLEGHIPVVRAYFLSRLLKGQAEPEAMEEESLQFMGVRFPYTDVCVILVEVDESSEFIADGSEREWALIRFILFNLSSELLGDLGYVTETDRNRLALLMNVPDDGEETRSERDRIIRELKRVTEERFRMRTAIGVSSVRSGLTEIGRCYGEALSALDYRIIHGSGTVILFDQIREIERGYYHYPIETEAQLMNYMKSGDYEEVVRLLDGLYEHNVAARSITPELGKTLLFNLLSTVLKVMNALKIDARQLPGIDSDPVKHIMSSSSAEKMLGRIKELSLAICDSVREARTDQSGRLNERLKQYIEENSADNGLSLTSIADHFGMTPQYVSGFFKKQNGINLTDYMVEVRVREAKRLLAESGLTVLQIAQKVGYATDIGFIRVFKKLEGITPGKYREMLAQQGDVKDGWSG